MNPSQDSRPKNAANIAFPYGPIPPSPMPLWHYPKLAWQLFTLRRLPKERLPLLGLNLRPGSENASDPSPKLLQVGQNYRLISWNIGFGAYTPDYSFFLDSYLDSQGRTLHGQHACCTSRQALEATMLNIGQSLLERRPDFVLLQEIDRPSNRSFGFDQVTYLSQIFPDLSGSFAANIKRPFMPYPWSEPIGLLHSGLLSLSPSPAAHSRRCRLPLARRGPFQKLIDLDRCLLWQRFRLSDRSTLNLINAHLSAYDAGGRSRQLQQRWLHHFLSRCLHRHERVILIGDFNQLPPYPPQDKNAAPDPDMQSLKTRLDLGFLPVGMRYLDARPNSPGLASCRNAATPYVPGQSEEALLDHCFVSSDIDGELRILDWGYVSSDHNPLEFNFQFLALN